MEEALKAIVREAVREALEQERPALIAELRGQISADNANGDPWLNVKRAAAYAGVEPDTIRAWAKAGLRHAYAGSRLRIRRSYLDAWMNRGHARQEPDLDAKVTSILDKIGAKK